MNWYSTGYYGVPGTSNRTKVHVLRNGATLCGTPHHPKAEYQFCASYIHRPYVTCERCKLLIDSATKLG